MSTSLDNRWLMQCYLRDAMSRLVVALRKCDDPLACDQAVLTDVKAFLEGANVIEHHTEKMT